MPSKETCLVSIPAGSLLSLPGSPCSRVSAAARVSQLIRRRTSFVCDGSSGSGVIRHVLTLDSTSVRGNVSPQYLLLGLMVELIASLP